MTVRQAVLGIDLGTSGVKALVAAPGGAVLGRGTAGYPVRVPASGRAESTPEDWWLATRAAVRHALAEADRVTVTALAVAGQMHGVVLADERGAPLRPAILWLDQRAAAEAATYAELPCEYTAVLGNRPSPGMAGPLLCWLMTHEPGTVRAAWWALQPKDWLRLRLTGQAATDPTDASGTLLFDLARNAWADPLIEKLGVPREKLPPVRDSADLGRPPAPRPGRRPRPAPGDPGRDRRRRHRRGAARHGPARRRGHAEPRQRRPVGRHGRTRSARRTPPRTCTGPSTAATTGSPRCRTSASPSTGCATCSGRPGKSSTTRPPARAGRTPRSSTPTCPRSAGTRAPTGAWTGLTLAHEREDLMRSALDGVAGLLRQRLDDLRAAGHAPRRVILGGGGTANPAWRDLLAQALGLPLPGGTGDHLADPGRRRSPGRPADLTRRQPARHGYWPGILIFPTS